MNWLLMDLFVYWVSWLLVGRSFIPPVSIWGYSMSS